MNHSADRLDACSSDAKYSAIRHRARAEDQVRPPEHWLVLERFDQFGCNTMELRAEKQQRRDAVESTKPMSRT